MNAMTRESFGALLSEKLAELEAAEGESQYMAEETAVDRLRLDVQRSVLASEGGPLPRQGHAAYLTTPAISAEPGQGALNILY